MPAPEQPVRAVLLDAFGTLITLVDPVPRLQAALAAVGAPNPASAVSSAMLTEVAFYRRLQDTGRDAASLAELRRSCGEVFVAALPNQPPPDTMPRLLLESLEYTPFPDAVPALTRLRDRGVRVGVVSNWDCSLDEILVAAGIRDLVDVVLASAVVGARKPDARIFEAALDALDLAPDAVIHCGDRPDEDCHGALAAGITPVQIVRDGELPTDTEWRVIMSLDEDLLTTPAAVGV